MVCAWWKKLITTVFFKIVFTQQMSLLDKIFLLFSLPGHKTAHIVNEREFFGHFLPKVNKCKQDFKMRTKPFKTFLLITALLNMVEVIFNLWKNYRLDYDVRGNLSKYAIETYFPKPTRKCVIQLYYHIQDSCAPAHDKELTYQKKRIPLCRGL